MVSLQAFRADHYNPAQSADLGEYLSPTDSPAHPHHFSQLHRASSQPAETLAQWLSEGVVTTASAPGFYIHTQQFTLHGQPQTRTNLFVMCEAIPFSDRLILPHEQTLNTPHDRSLEHMQTSQASLQPVFALYSDHEAFLDGYCEEVQEAPPLLQFTDAEGVQHTLWQDPQPERIDRVSAWFRGRQLYLADGHHRYQSALQYRHWQAQQPSATPAGNYLLMYLSNIYDPGLHVLANHRLLTPQGSLPPLAEVVARLQRYFSVEALPGDALFKHLAAAGPEVTALGLDYEGHSLLLTRPKGLPESVAPHRSMSYRQLDLVVLHELVFPLLECPQEWARDPAYFQFSPDPQQIRAWLRAGTGQAGFYLNPPSVRDICGVAMAGETLPPKATHFYPKAPNGLLWTRFAHAF